LWIWIKSKRFKSLIKVRINPSDFKLVKIPEIGVEKYKAKYKKPKCFSLKEVISLGGIAQESLEECESFDIKRQYKRRITK